MQQNSKKESDGSPPFPFATFLSAQGQGHRHSEPDDEEQERINKASKSAKRLARKQSKIMNMMTDQLVTSRSWDPTQWLVIYGLGLSFKTKKANVFRLFNPQPEEVRFYTEKPYCAVRFGSDEDADVARQMSVMKEVDPVQPLTMGFISNEPPPEDTDLTSFHAANWPKGLALLADFISKEEHDLIKNQLLPELQENGTALKNRVVKHYGYEFRYGTNDVDLNEPLSTGAGAMPSFLDPILERMIQQKIIPRKPEQLTVNYYTSGQGIPPHVDTHSVFESPIVSLSLGSSTVMDFRDEDNKTVSVVLPPSSLLVMDGQSRYKWTHGIANRTVDIIPDLTYGGATAIEREARISLTFRLLRKVPYCDCSFPEMCDSQQGKINDENADKIETELVHKVYDSIAAHFDQTRHSPWPKVKEFVDSIAASDPGNCFLDIGCGNGKYFSMTDYIYQVGTDMCTELLNIAQSKGQGSVQAVRSTCLRLPFINNSFDATICIAVLHHLATPERRLEAVKEILRITRPGGQGLIYVWAKNQRLDEIKSVYMKQRELKASYYNAPSAECMVPLKNYSFIPVHQPGQADFASDDVLVPWMNSQGGKNELHHRFYHVFVRGELDALLEQVEPCPRILDSYYDQGNWCVRFQKVA